VNSPLKNADLARLLCHLISPTTSIEECQAIQNVNWLQLIEFANKHFLNFALFSGLRDKQLLSCADNNTQQYLLDFYEKNVQRNQEVLDELNQVILILNNNGIKPVLFKGAAAIADNWYQDIGSRFMSDIDLLVDEKHIKIAYKALTDDGYVKIEEGLGSTHHHVPALLKQNSVVTIELHRSPLSVLSKKFTTL